MIPKDVSYLRCIKCGKSLELEVFERSGKECTEGKLSCKSCNSFWPVINGIPRILPDSLMESLVLPNHKNFFERHGRDFDMKKRRSDESEKLKKMTAESFGFEWLKYPTILNHFENDWNRYFNPFIKKADIKNKVVADFGCGMAKHGYFTAKYGARKYIGLDLSEAVEAAYRNTKQSSPLIVQADIYNIPLRGDKLDILYSIGVLHHLPDPEKGFLKIAALMKKGSKIFIWVYGRKGNRRATMFYVPLRRVTTRLPKNILYPLCHIPAIAVHLLNLSTKAFIKIGFREVGRKLPFSYYADFPYMFKVSDTFDTLGTPKQVYYEEGEIKGWFGDAGMANANLKYDKIQGIKGFAVR